MRRRAEPPAEHRARCWPFAGRGARTDFLAGHEEPHRRVMSRNPPAVPSEWVSRALGPVRPLSSRVRGGAPVGLPASKRRSAGARFPSRRDQREHDPLVARPSGCPGSASSMDGPRPSAPKKTRPTHRPCTPGYRSKMMNSRSVTWSCHGRKTNVGARRAGEMMARSKEQQWAKAERWNGHAPARCLTSVPLHLENSPGV